VGSGCSCSMEGELGCSVFSVYLSSARLGVIWLTSAPFDIRSRPIYLSAELMRLELTVTFPLEAA
jgi:hypothetical protein